MTDELKPCPVNGKHMSAAHEKACPVCSPRLTPPADVKLDALVKRLNELYAANGTDYVQHAVNAIQSLRQQVADVSRECVDAQTAWSKRYLEYCEHVKRLESELASRDQRIADLMEQVAALESREVCAAAHDNVEECGYCQRDRLQAKLASVERDAEKQE